LIETRRLLAKGWTNHYYWTADGRTSTRGEAKEYCLVGAAAVAACETVGSIGTSKSTQRLLAAIQQHMPDPYREYEYPLRACLCFNDDTNQQKVLDVLDKAIAAQDS
jgi:hypothetical protein